MSKSQQLFHRELPSEVAFFIGKHVRSNIRELEGALRRINANAQFTGKEISVDFAKEALRDMIDAQARMVTLDNIQKNRCRVLQDPGLGPALQQTQFARLRGQDRSRWPWPRS